MGMEDPDIFQIICVIYFCLEIVIILTIMIEKYSFSILPNAALSILLCTLARKFPRIQCPLNNSLVGKMLLLFSLGR